MSTRYYIVMIRDYEWRCGGQHPGPRGDDSDLIWRRCLHTKAHEEAFRQAHGGNLTNYYASCTHDMTPLDTWSPYSNRDGIAVYINPGSAARRAKMTMNGEKSYYDRRPPREAKVMYFEHDDLCTWTDDPEAEYQEHEAKMDRYAQKAMEAQKKAAEYERPPEPKPKRTRKKS